MLPAARASQQANQTTDDNPMEKYLAEIFHLLLHRNLFGKPLPVVRPQLLVAMICHGCAMASRCPTPGAKSNGARIGSESTRRPKQEASQPLICAGKTKKNPAFLQDRRVCRSDLPVIIFLFPTRPSRNRKSKSTGRGAKLPQSFFSFASLCAALAAQNLGV